jgi:DhnA family fructose-bisphosphate aldolase class Ia
MRAIHYAQQPFLEFLKWYNRSFKSKWEMLPQVWWYTHKKKLHSDYQIRFENLEHDINKVSKELGMDIIKIPHNNKSSESFTIEDVYCDESISIINKWYKEDFKKLDYLLWS